jgi:hypothetical protein
MSEIPLSGFSAAPVRLRERRFRVELLGMAGFFVEAPIGVGQAMLTAGGPSLLPGRMNGSILC